MTNPESVSEQIAKALLQINAIKINVGQPFTWASGILSPVYCDNRRILSFPEVRLMVANKLAALVREHFPGTAQVAGVATGAIAHGMMVAHLLELPFVYVRSKPKQHGLGNQIEGLLRQELRTVVVEDLVSTGQSSIAAVNALREQGVEVTGMAAIFSYGLKQAEDTMRTHNCRLHTLSNFQSLIQVALALKIIGPDEAAALTSWQSEIQLI